jgi:hypothetical protein
VSDAYRIESADGSLAVVPKKPGTAGSAISLEKIGGPFPDPDLWTFEPAPESPGSYYIVDAEGSLVIDIETPVIAGSGLQLLERKHEPNQLWRLEAVPNQPGCYYIASGAKALVMGVGQPVAPGIEVRAVERKPEANEWWRVLTNTGAPAQPPAAQPGERKDAGSA